VKSSVSSDNEGMVQGLTRQRVLANIEESQAARAASRFDEEVLFARAAQQYPGYGGVDAWAPSTVPKGTKLFGGLPGQSNFYTTASDVLASGYTDAAMSRALQVAPHPAFGYRPAMGAYEVLENLRVPASQCLANPQNGIGGATQYFIRDLSRLKLVSSFPLNPGGVH